MDYPLTAFNLVSLDYPLTAFNLVSLDYPLTAFNLVLLDYPLTAFNLVSLDYPLTALNLVLLDYPLTAFTSDYCLLLNRVDCCRLLFIVDLTVPHSLTPKVFSAEITILPLPSNMSVNKSHILIPLHAYLSLELFHSISP